MATINRTTLSGGSLFLVHFNVLNVPEPELRGLSTCWLSNQRERIYIKRHSWRGMLSKIKCIIIHGCPSNVEKAMNPETRTYDKHWIPWAKKQLSAKGIVTETPIMPTPWQPEYSQFKKEFEKWEC